MKKAIFSLLFTNNPYTAAIVFKPINFRDQKDEKSRLNKDNFEKDKIMQRLFTFYFSFFVLNMMFAVPEHQMSTGVHQKVGDCQVFDTDLSGHKRQVYLCQEQFEEDFNFDCPAFKDFKTTSLLEHGTEWYTVCGNPHSDKFQYLMAEIGLAILGIFMFKLAFAHDNKTKSQ